MDQTLSAVRTAGTARRVPWRVVAFVVLLVAYLLLTLGVVYHSPLLTLDRDVVRLDLRERYYGWLALCKTCAMLGQRAPASLVALPWFAWRSWMSRSPRPLLMLGTALVVLNVTVGLVKLATGRLGPLATHQVHAVFAGGDIYPSGHVSNAVVLYGLIAMVAVKYRKTAAVAAVLISLVVGVTTIYLDTHWLSDVFGGWLAGALVLIMLPWLMPLTDRLAAAVARFGRWVWRISHPLLDEPPATRTAARSPEPTIPAVSGRHRRVPMRAPLPTSTTPTHADV